MSLLVFLGIQEETLKIVRKQLNYRLSRKKALKTLKEYSEQFMLRRIKSEIPSLSLPRKKQWLTELFLSHAEQEIYNGVHTSCVVKFNEFLKKGTVMENYAYILVMINKLRRAACHPLLGISKKNRSDVQDTKHIKPSAKVTAVMRDIHRYIFQEHRKIVLFSQWTDMLDIIQYFLCKEKIKFSRYDGKMKLMDRNDALVDFKTNPTVNIILVSLKAGGQGLNLCEGTVAMFMDHWWNGAAEDQATDRIHRIGQTRPVDVIRYTTKNTIEENVLSLQRKKRVHEVAITEKKPNFAKLRVEDLSLLFKAPG
jgi:SNF2 family DNA or RNA helicase